MIPKKLNFIWVGDPAQRPEACIRSWTERHPGWETRVWSNDDLRDREWANASHLRTMLAERQWCGVADLMRWELLYDEGGVFLDADSVCLRPLSDDLLEGEAFACWENEIERPGMISNAYLGGVAGNSFFGQIILDIKATPSIAGLPAWRSTGPQRITDAYRTHRYDGLTIYPSHFFIPRHYTGRVYHGGGRVFADQIWGSTNRSYARLSECAPRWAPGAHRSRLPEITVGMITRNHGRWLREAVMSVLEQDYPSFEVVVVDDGSTDDTPEILASISNPRLRAFRNPPTGVPDSRNRVLHEACGKYVCWLDGDGELLPGTLRAYGERALDWPETIVFYGNLLPTDAEGRIGAPVNYDNYAGNGHLLARLFMGNRMPSSGTLVRTDWMRDVSGFDCEMGGSCDYDLWLRLAAEGAAFQHIGWQVAKYRRLDSGLPQGHDRLGNADLHVLHKTINSVSMEYLCSDLPWHDPDQALTRAIARVGLLLKERGDVDHASEWIREAQARATVCAVGSRMETCLGV